MSNEAKNDLLGDLLEDYLARRAAGEAPLPEEYRERAGAEFGAFCELLATESALDAAMEIAPELPLPRAFGTYTLLRELGRGAAGIVYEALHRDLDRPVAVKVLRTGFDTTPEAIERFQREAVAAAQVRHDHIVEVYEAGQADGRPYYAMALLHGRSLAQLLRDGELPPARELCGELAGVADALHVLHEAGIIHRDVKPSNIMRDSTGRYVLADFGLARAVVSPELTKSGDTLGTPLYMSPEQILGKREEIDGRTDVYGLGASLYELLTNKPPFRATDLRQLMHGILEARPQPPSELAPDLPRDCERVVLQALAKRLDDRYATAAALRDDLTAIARNEAVAARPVGTVQHGARALRRRWMPLAAAATVLAGIALWYARRPATLRVDAFPGAEVLLDGKARGHTPVELNVPPGRYTLALRTEGFGEHGQPLQLDAGQQFAVSVALVARTPGDPVAARRLAAHFDVALKNLESFQTDRAGDIAGDFVLPVYPRGTVRGTELATFRLDVGPEFMPGGTLQFRRGEEVLHKQDFDPTNVVTKATLPTAVRTALRDGDNVTWGYFPRRGAPRTTTFRYVTTPTDPRLARLDAQVAEHNPVLARTLRAQVLLDGGFALAAYRTMQSAKPTRENLAIALAALRQLGLDGNESRLWTEAAHRTREQGR